MHKYYIMQSNFFKKQNTGGNFSAVGQIEVKCYLQTIKVVKVIYLSVNNAEIPF